MFECCQTNRTTRRSPRPQRPARPGERIPRAADGPVCQTSSTSAPRRPRRTQMGHIFATADVTRLRLVTSAGPQMEATEARPTPCVSLRSAQRLPGSSALLSRTSDAPRSHPGRRNKPRQTRHPFRLFTSTPSRTPPRRCSSKCKSSLRP